MAKVLKRQDYKPLDFTIHQTYLDFDIALPQGTVKSTLHVRRLNKDVTSFTLNGQRLELLSLKINGVDFKDYTLTEIEGIDRFQDLTIDVSSLENQDDFVLEITNKFIIENNTLLQGIYKAGDQIISQCEAHGFRLITFYFDRPDCLSEFHVRIESDRKLRYLLSNGNKVGEGVLENDESRHYCEWHDPYPKPCYLFALCAADFDVIEDEFITRSGRKVELKLFADLGKKEKLRFAMSAIKRAMKWDEDRFDLEYDLDLFMIVATPYFNMGAMENKGLNIFNDACLIGDKDTTDDRSLVFIDSVVAHEYFHNWTGDRVTCRDWFQLTLKEGLTVFRDQEYTSDTFNRTLKRIQDVDVVKFNQFNEDRGPMSHPIRPDSVQSQENFYTVTVYNKGAEVIRMIHTLLGEANFQKGMKLYFKRHDGQAVTCDDFVNAMQDASGIDLTSFRKWYSQSGTPQVKVVTEYDAASKVYTIKFSQHTDPTNDQKEKQPLFLILKTELMTKDGKILKGLKTVDGADLPEIITFDTAEHTVQVAGLEQEPILTTNLDFSSPIEVKYDYTLEELCTIASHSNNLYARYDAVERIDKILYTTNLERLAKGEELEVPQAFLDLNRSLLQDCMKEPGFYSKVISVTNPYAYLMTQTENANPLHNLEIKKFIDRKLFEYNGELALEKYKALPHKPYEHSFEQIGLRLLRASLLTYITRFGDHKELVEELYNTADCFTDRQNALAINTANKLGLDHLEEEFLQRFEGQTLPLDTIIANRGKRCNSIEDIKKVQEFPTYDHANPNRVRQLIAGVFSNVEFSFAEDGKFFEWFTDFLIETDKVNPHLSSRLSQFLLNFYKFAEPWRTTQLNAIKKLKARDDLTLSLSEMIDKAVQLAESLENK